MVLDQAAMIELATTLSDEVGIRATAKETAKGGLIAGIACAMGGLVAGPPGLAVGGAVGGGIAYGLARDKFKPLSKIITEDLNDEQRERLAAAVRRIVSSVDAADLLTLMAAVGADETLRTGLTTEITNFASSQLNLYVSQDN